MKRDNTLNLASFIKEGFNNLKLEEFRDRKTIRVPAGENVFCLGERRGAVSPPSGG